MSYIHTLPKGRHTSLPNDVAIKYREVPEEISCSGFFVKLTDYILTYKAPAPTWVISQKMDRTF